MIALVHLEPARHCLQRPADMPHYVCRARRGHRGPHEYLPIDMVMIAEAPAPAPAQRTPQPPVR